MASGPLVSIVTACYNHEPYLDDYFTGLLNQTYRNLELVLIDDGSTDRSWDKVVSYLPRLQAAFPRVVCQRQENAGPWEVTIRALGQTTGDCFCFLESDDYYLPTKVEESVRYLEEHPDAGMVHSQVEHVRDGRIVAYQPNQGRPIPSGRVLDQLLERNFINTCGVLCRTEAVKRYGNFRAYRDRGYRMGDYPIWLRIARESEVGYIPKPLARYRVRAESASHSQSPLMRYRFAKSFDQIKLDFIKEYGIDSPAVAKVMRERHITLFYGGYTLLQKDDCLEGYRWLAEHYPAEFATWKQRLRMALVRNEPLWKAVRRVEDLPVVRRLFGANEIAP